MEGVRERNELLVGEHHRLEAELQRVIFFGNSSQALKRAERVTCVTYVTLRDSCERRDMRYVRYRRSRRPSRRWSPPSRPPTRKWRSSD